MLAAIEQHSDRSLSWWIGRGKPIQSALLSAGRRGDPRNPAGPQPPLIPARMWAGDAAAERIARCEAIAYGAVPTSPAEAALTGMALIARVLVSDGVAPTVPPTVLDACGPVRWLVEAADQLISRSRSEDTTAITGGGG
jgi:hypothetical protein